MKRNTKDIIKGLLLTSIASLYSSDAKAETPVIADATDESNNINAFSSNSHRTYKNVLKMSPNGEFSSVASHSSHSSHASHSSHTSSSHYSSSHYSSTGTSSGGSSGGKANGKAVGIATGAIVGGALATWGVVKLVKAIKKHKRYKSYKPKKTRSSKVPPTYYLGSREIKKRSIGNDVNELVDSLVKFGVLDRSVLSFHKNTRYYKYDKNVKVAVKKMSTIMNGKPSNGASISFLLQLRTWSKTRNELINKVGYIGTEISGNKDILHVLAVLLTEKGYLSGYNVYELTNAKQEDAIVKAYNQYLKDKGLPESIYFNREKIDYFNSKL